jgi:glycosyltransferase involved in cell wall biosynthesis
VKPRVLVNGGGSRVGGSGTYLLAVAEEIGRTGDRGLAWEFLTQPDLARLIHDRVPEAVSVRDQPIASTTRRILWEQLHLGRGLGGPGSVLLTVGNFGPLLRRDRYVLLAQNALHFVDVEVKGAWGARLRVESALARASVRRSHTTLAPSESMADLVTARTGRHVTAVPFGPGLAQSIAPTEDGRFVFLHRTHWGPHKRLGDILLAARELSETHAGRFVVRSACDPRSDFAREFSSSAAERRLLDDAVIAEHVQFGQFDLGGNGQQQLRGDAVLLPSTIESFCFPIAEGIAAGLPVVASEASFARELCGDSAFYVRPGDTRALAGAMRRMLEGERPPPPTRQLRERLSWSRHVDQLADVCHGAAQARAPENGVRGRRLGR